MMTNMQRRLREDGFTLIELLIVIVVLGILASIVLFAVGNTKNEADDAHDLSNQKICDTAKAASLAHDGTIDNSMNWMQTDAC